MDFQSLNSKTMVELRKLAKEKNLKVPAGTSKIVLIDMLLEAWNTPAQAESPKAVEPKQETPKPELVSAATAEEPPAAPAKRPRGRPRKNAQPQPVAEGKTETKAREEKRAVEKKKEKVERPSKPMEQAKPAAEAPKSETAAQPAQPPKPVQEASPMEGKPLANAPAEQPIEIAQAEGKPAEKAEEAPKPVAQLRAPRPLERRPISREEVGAPQRVERRTLPGRTSPNGRSVNPNPTFRNPPTIPQRGEGVQRAQSPSPLRTPPMRVVQPEREEAPVVPLREPEAPAQPRYTQEQVSSPLNARPRRDYTDVDADGVPVGDFADGSGLLEIQQDGYGFLRADNCLPGKNDTYLSIAQIRRFNLRNGDFVEGKTRPQRDGDRYSAMVHITKINGLPPEQAIRRPVFESLVPWYPNERLRLEGPKHSEYSLRLIDILAPIGKGQRGMIVSQPKAGKTTLLKQIANAISDNNPEVKLIVLLIDERPEEVTDMKRSIRGDVIYSTFDEAPENHARVSEMVLEHAQRMVEMGQDVVILMDSITRLARAYNLIIPPTGRSLSGGLDPGALYKPKKFFGAARNIEDGGSLTIIATALVETGSRMDDIIFEEFKGTGNMELHLDRRLSDKRIFPAIDLVRSGTRREELLLSPKELDGAYSVRKILSGNNSQQSTEMLLGLLEKTANNDDFLSRIKGWLNVYEKEGFSASGK